MPDISPGSPADFVPFNSDEEHVRAHRALETALEKSPATGPLVAAGTSSTAAPIQGFYRTAATVNVGIPSMSTTSAITTVVSVESQTGNPVQPGVPIIASPQGALPVGVVSCDAYCVNTNSIIFQYTSISGINATTTVAYHVFSIDTIP